MHATPRSKTKAEDTRSIVCERPDVGGLAQITHATTAALTAEPVEAAISTR
jgi:hypothetical protein